MNTEDRDPDEGPEPTTSTPLYDYPDSKWDTIFFGSIIIGLFVFLVYVIWTELSVCHLALVCAGGG